LLHNKSVIKRDKREELYVYGAIQNKVTLKNIFISNKNDTGMNNTEKVEYKL